MSNKPLTALLVVNLFGMLILAYLHFFDREKLVYIDSSKVINAYHGMVEARKAYQAKIVLWKTNIDTLNNQIQKEIQQYERERTSMTVKERQLTEQIIQDKQH